MEISCAAIVIAYYIVNNEHMPGDKPFKEAAYELGEAGHYALLVTCNQPEILKAYVENTGKNLEPVVAIIPELALRPYRIRSGTKYLRVKATGEYVRKGGSYSGYMALGGNADTNEVELIDGRTMPANEVGMEWK